MAEVVNQVIRDNFRSWDVELIDVKKVAGLTLREVVTRDKQAFIDGGGSETKFGAGYYAKLKTQYRSDKDPVAQLLCTDETLVVNAELMAAMVAAHKAKPERTKIQSYCQRKSQAHNTKEISGIFTYFLTLKVGCKKQLPVAMDMVRFSSGCSCRTSFLGSGRSSKIVSTRCSSLCGTEHRSS